MKKDVLIIVLIVLLALLANYHYGSIAKFNDVSREREKLIEQIEESKMKLDSIEKARPVYEYERDKLIDSIQSELDSIRENVREYKELEKYEKDSLYDASDDVNVRYFTEYINGFRTRQDK